MAPLNNYLQSLEVQVMLDTLRVIHNPLQDFALVALMKSPMFSFDEDELARLALQKFWRIRFKRIFMKN